MGTLKNLFAAALLFAFAGVSAFAQTKFVDWPLIPTVIDNTNTTCTTTQLPAASAANSGKSAYVGNTAQTTIVLCRSDGSNWIQVSGSGGGGGVSSVGLALTSVPWLTVSGSPVTSSGNLGLAPTAAQTSHEVIGTCGSATTVGLCALTGAELPNPSATTLGGIESITSASHNWVAYIDTSGVPHQSQPASTDISGLGTAATQNTGTSGANLGLLNANLTFSGSNAYGTPASITLTNGSGLPISGISGLGSGIGTALANALNGASGVQGTVSVTTTGSNCGSASITGAVLNIPGCSPSGSSLTPQVNGTGYTAAPTFNFIGGSGIALSSTGTSGGVFPITFAVNTAVIASRAQLTAGSDQACVSSNGTTAYTCTHSNVWTAYGQFFLLSVDVASNSSASVNADGIGALTLYRNDCATSIGTDIPAGGSMWFQVSGGKACEVVPGKVDFADVTQVPAANCVNSVPGAAWDTTLTAACTGGTNNKGGILPFVDSSTAQFGLQLPGDWDSTQQPYVKIVFDSGSNTSGTVIFTVAVACSKADGSVTSDPAFNTADALATSTMAAASRDWSSTVQMTQVTSGNNCIPGGEMRVKVTRSTDTAASAVNVHRAVITVPRLQAVQAN